MTRPRLVGVILTLAFALGCGGGPPAKPGILFAGTSLTAGYGLPSDSAYPQRLQRTIDSAGLGFRVMNAGVSGETSADLLARIDKLLDEPYVVVVIETGANDGVNRMPVDSTRANIERVIQRVRARQPAARIGLVQMEVPPVLSSGIVLGAPYAASFREMFRVVAKRTGVVLLPFLLEGVAGRPELNLPDEFHPNAQGQRQLAENVWKGLRPMLP